MHAFAIATSSLALAVQVRVVIADERGAQLFGGAAAAAMRDVFHYVEHILKQGAGDEASLMVCNP